MGKATINEIIVRLKDQSYHFDKGLSNSEVSEIERQFLFQFPPDLRIFLQTSLPISAGFPNWRQSLEEGTARNLVLKQLSWPLEGMLFDVEENNLWLDEWEEKPDTTAERIKIITQHFRAYPTLIPIFGHRYIPNTPFESGNPIFSVYQMDIIVYANDLQCYLDNEFNLRLPSHQLTGQNTPKIIPFWSACADL